MRRTLELLAFVTALSCGCSLQGSAPEPPVEDILGTWELAKVAGGAPSALNIQTHTIVFEPDGRWRFVSTMTGPWSGTTLKGSGTWVQASDGFHFTAGANTQRVAVTRQGEVLRLHPDPVLTGPGGSPPVDAEYHRPMEQANPALQPTPQGRRG